MDDRQPPAAHKTRDSFCGLPKRGLAFLLANLMFWQPLWARADGIVVSAPGTSLGQAGNGVPIVNIAAPNGSGLSHNRFKDYNVGSNGVILNNATHSTQATQLGAIILGNPNLKGTAARVILNEVNGGNPSQLRGYTEVAGQSAHVIVANPYGITCNGCGFINTPRATLTTGKPIIENGQLTRYQVDQGSVAIDGAGLNANNIDRFEIITRSARINAQIQAKNLAIIAGRNDVNAGTLNATARADDGSAKPQLAIDSSALGGMYAGAIKLVGTEAGVGVKLDGKLIASGGDIQLDANGHLSLAQTAAVGAVNVKAASLDAQGPVYAGTALNAQTQGNLSNQQSLAARDSITLSAGGQLNNNGIIEAGVNADNTRNASGDVSLTGQHLDNRGKTLIASRNLTANVAQTLNNQGGTLSAGQTTRVKAGTLDNQSKGRVLSSHTLNLTANTLFNTQGQLSSEGTLNLTAAQVSNQDGGRIASQGALTASVTGLDQQGGQLFSNTSLSLDMNKGQLNNQGGLINTPGTLLLQNLNGVNNQGGEISSSQSFNLRGQTLDNSGGKLISRQNLSLDGKTLVNQNGLISGWQGLLVTGASLDNRNDGTLSSRNGNLNVNLLGNLLNGNGGALVSQGSLGVTAVSVDNSRGILSSAGAQNLNLGGALDNGQGGLIDSGAGLTIKATSVANASGAVNAQQTLTLDAKDVNNRQGTLVGNAAVNLNLDGVLDNSGAKLASAGPLSVKGATAINNQGGQLASQDQMTLLTGALDNSNTGTVAAKNTLAITATGAVQNLSNGLIYSQTADVALSAASLANGKGELQGQTGLDLELSGTLDNLGGKLIAQAGDVSVSAASIDNRGGTLAALKGALQARTVGVLRKGFDLNNQGGVIQGQRLNLRALAGLDNNGGRIAAQAGDVIIDSADLNNRNGGLYATGLVNVSGASLDNSAGQLAGNRIELGLSGVLTNSAGMLESDSTLALRAASVDNQGGKLRALGASGTTDFQIGSLFDNRNGSLETANTQLTLAANSFLNSGGQLLHLGDGAFDISLPNVTGAGGTLVTRGGLTLNADSWTNTSVIQAGRLSVNVNNFTQMQTGQLLASTRLDGSGGNWVNNGLIASDGDLQLSLGGTYSGVGRVSSLGRLSLKAASVSLPDAGRITGGGSTDISAGSIINRGRMTANDDLLLDTSSLNNYGTLGSAQDLTVNATQLLNDKGLIFSGAGMQLRSDRLKNHYADIYSFGDLSISRNAAGARADELENISGTLESAGDMRLLATSITNRKDELTYTQQRVNGYITHSCAHCSDEWNVWYYVNEIYETTLDKDSPSAFITSGGNLAVTGSNFLNQYSSVSAARNIDITVDTFKNEGVNLETVTYRSHYRNPADREPGSIYLGLIGPGGAVNEYNKYSARYVPLYRRADGGYFYQQESGLSTELNPDYDPSKNMPVPVEVTRYGVFSATQTASTGKSVDAVIQSGGSTTIIASTSLDNGVQRVNAPILTSDSKVDATGTLRATTPLLVHLNSQLPPDLAQQRIDPLTLPGFVIPEGQNGLFRLSGQGTSDASASPVLATPRAWTIGGASPGSASQTVAHVTGLPSATITANPHKYLIETNPALTELKQFMSSDYLLQSLGYDPDQSARRLGDGFYEQRLVQQAVIARTGQRFLEGQTSNEGMFKYLMNNALASKQALDLAVGVSLTSEQVAALTHDIVWMENVEVNGEPVLAPVLYLAHANNRLATTGALIQGQDVTLIAGKDLSNAGTLRASNNLSATAANDLTNSGLMEAGQRLDLLAGNDLSNKAGGIIAGRDVSLTTARGDVVNERTVTHYNDKNGAWSWSMGVADSAARIESGNTLSIAAGRDFNTIGSVLRSGNDLSIEAGRDVNIVSAQKTDRITDHGAHDDSAIKQLASEVTAGRDLNVTAGRHLTAIASEIQAKRDVGLRAGADMTLASAADEVHSYNKGSSVTRKEDHLSQVATTVKAGGDVVLGAGNDMTLIASRIDAANEAYLVAQNELRLLAAQDSDYTLYDMKKKGGWGSKKTQRDEVTDVKNIGSEISAGGNVTLVSGGDQRYQVAKLESGGDIALDSGGAITFEALKDLHKEDHAKSKVSMAWSSMSGKGSTDETLRQTRMVAAGAVAIKAVDGLNIDIKQVNQETVHQSIQAMVDADPQLAWLAEAEKRGDVDWRQVKEVHDSYKYSHSGMGPAVQMIVAILVVYFSAGAASGLIGSMASATAGSGTAMAAAGTATASAVAGGAAAGSTVAAGWANVALTAIATSTASNATISFINNGGNLGAVVEDVTSSQALRGYMVSGVTAGLTASIFDEMTGTTTTVEGALPNAGKVVAQGGLSSLEGLGRFGANQLLQNGTSTLLDRALGGDSQFDVTLRTSLANTFAAAGFNLVGDRGQEYDLKEGGLAKVGLHAVMGGLAAEAAGGDFKTGALAAGANELLIDSLAEQYTEMTKEQKDRLLVMNSQIVGVLAAAAQGGDAKNLQTGSWVAGSATSYNRLLHSAEKKALADEAKALEEKGKPQSDMSWEEVLLLAANAQVDATENARLQALVNSFPPGNPEGQHLAQDLLTATESIQGLAAQNTTLTWRDGRTIVAHGSEVHAFQATTTQLVDPALFNTASQWSSHNNWANDPEIVPTAWREQFGENAVTYLREIAGVSSSRDEFSDLVQRVSTVVGGGIESVTWDLDAALAVTGAPAVLRALLARRLAVAGGADTVVGAKGVSGSTLTRDELISGLPVGTKITPENVVDIRRLPDGRTVWLENGTDAAGLQHIYKRHEVDFINKGVSRDDIPTVVMSALERGQVVGTNGSANVYRITYNGVEQNIAIGIGSNGFVVRANPVSSWRPLP